MKYLIFIILSGLFYLSQAQDIKVEASDKIKGYIINGVKYSKGYIGVLGEGNLKLDIMKMDNGFNLLNETKLYLKYHNKSYAGAIFVPSIRNTYIRIQPDFGSAVKYANTSTIYTYIDKDGNFPESAMDLADNEPKAMLMSMDPSDDGKMWLALTLSQDNRRKNKPNVTVRVLDEKFNLIWTRNIELQQGVESESRLSFSFNVRCAINSSDTSVVIATPYLPAKGKSGPYGISTAIIKRTGEPVFADLQIPGDKHASDTKVLWDKNQHIYVFGYYRDDVKSDEAKGTFVFQLDEKGKVTMNTSESFDVRTVDEFRLMDDDKKNTGIPNLEAQGILLDDGSLAIVGQRHYEAYGFGYYNIFVKLYNINLRPVLTKVIQSRAGVYGGMPIFKVGANSFIVFRQDVRPSNGLDTKTGATVFNSKGNYKDFEDVLGNLNQDIVIRMSGASRISENEFLLVGFVWGKTLSKLFKLTVTPNENGQRSH